ncbi:MAG: amidohydrolase family protein [Planctomycetaceae bacterium]
MTNRAKTIALATLFCFLSMKGLVAWGQGTARPAELIAILFKNVKVFDGKSESLSAATSVLVIGNKIEKIGNDIAAPEKATTIEGNGRTLMPGLIDAHWHTMMCSVPMRDLMTADASYIHLLAGREAERTLMRGFTTVRDAAGPAFGLKRAIDEGKLVGPRIYPSGAMISQTGGHGDFRQRFELTKRGQLSRAEELGAGIVADGVPEVTRAAREQLMLGASQIKVASGGGVSSFYDPVDVTQYSVDELRAAVKAADNWGTYVFVHAYTSEAIQQAVEAGVKCIDHGQLMDEGTAKLLAEKGVWLSTQPFLDDEDSNPQPDPLGRMKQLQVSQGTDLTYRMAKKHKVKVAWGTDILFDPRSTAGQGKCLAKMVRWFEPHEVFRMATSTNAELLQLSGPRNPYPGKLGVIEAGALADILLVEGDPLTDPKLIANPEKNLVVIMKDGVIFKNLLR